MNARTAEAEMNKIVNTQSKKGAEKNEGFPRKGDSVLKYGGVQNNDKKSQIKYGRNIVPDCQGFTCRDEKRGECGNYGNIKQVAQKALAHRMDLIVQRRCKDVGGQNKFLYYAPYFLQYLHPLPFQIRVLPVIFLLPIFK